MTRSPEGRSRRTLFVVGATMSCILGAGGAALLLLYWSSPAWQERLALLLGPPDAALIWQVTLGLLGATAVLALLTYLFSFDSRAPRRPRLALALVFAAAGALAGVAAASALLLDSGPLSPPGLGMIAALALALAGLVLGFEALVRRALERALRRADEAHNRARAFFLSRLLLAFRPGRLETFRSVALERFRRGDRSPEILEDLESLYKEGAPSEDVTAALCRLAAERRDATAYLLYLNRLFALRPEDPDLLQALIDENLAQGHKGDARRLMENRGVGSAPEELEIYASLLIDQGDPGRAVEVAQRLGEQEGIPYKRSGALLRRAIEADPKLFPALNLLGEQALESRNLEQAARRFEASLALLPAQPRIRRALQGIYREAGLLDRLERLLAEDLAAPGAPAEESHYFEYAEILILNKRQREAREVLEAGLRCHPQSFRLIDRLAESLCDTQEWEEAAAKNALALQAAPDDEARARCRRRAARIERAQLSAELYDLQQEVEKNPADIDLGLELIRRLTAHGQADRALAHAGTLLHRQPASRGRVKELLGQLGLAPEGPFIFLSFLADLHLADGDGDAALALIEPMRARSLDPDAVELELLQRLLQRKPNHAGALRRSGEIHQRLRHFAQMVHFYVLYLAHGGEAAPEINRALFSAYLELKDYENAALHAERLFAADATDARAPLRLAQLAFEQGRLDDTLRWANLALERAAGQSEARALIRQVERLQAERRGKQLQARVESGAATPAEFEELADLRSHLDDLDQAIPLYQKAARDSERALRVKLKLAICMAQKGLLDLADETVRDFHLPPDTPETATLMELYYDLAGLFERERKLEIAHRIYKQLFLVDAGFRDVVKKVQRFS